MMEHDYDRARRGPGPVRQERHWYPEFEGEYYDREWELEGEHPVGGDNQTYGQHADHPYGRPDRYYGAQVRHAPDLYPTFGPEEHGDRRFHARPGTHREPLGPHVGRGPRGYERSNERIREEVADRLSADPWIDASQIDLAVEAGVVTLTGSVEDRRQKRLAEDVADSVSGVRDVQNQLRIEPTTGSEPRFSEPVR